ncbi:MAG: hypothetical protein ACJ790_19880, partial [Myxococcaceae bacterium]
IFATSPGDLEFFIALEKVDAAHAQFAQEFRDAAAAQRQTSSEPPNGSTPERPLVPEAVVRLGRPLQRALRRVAPGLATSIRNAFR